MADLTESVMADIARVGGDTSFFTAAAERANETILDELAAEFPMLDRDNEVEPCLQAANFVYGTPPLSLLGRKRCWLSLLRLGATWWNPSIVVCSMTSRPCLSGPLCCRLLPSRPRIHGRMGPAGT